MATLHRTIHFANCIVIANPSEAKIQYAVI